MNHSPGQRTPGPLALRLSIPWVQHHISASVSCPSILTLHDMGSVRNVQKSLRPLVWSACRTRDVCELPINIVESDFYARMTPYARG